MDVFDRFQKIRRNIRLRVREWSWRDELHPMTVNYAKSISELTDIPFDDAIKGKPTKNFDRKMKGLE